MGASLSLLPQGKGRTRGQNRNASGDEGVGSSLEMELANVKHMETECSCGERGLGSGPVSDRNLRAFLVEGHWHRGGLRAQAMGSQASLGVVGASRCPVWDIRSPGEHARQRRRKQSWVGLSRISTFLGLGWGWKENLSLAWTEDPGTWVRAAHHQAGRASGWGTMPEGRARSIVRVRPKGRAPSPAADEPLLSSLPSPPGFTVHLCSAWRGKTATS